MTTPPLPSFDPAERRTQVRRTAWLFAGLALAVFVGFIVISLSGR
jgi:hypothetical protein